MLLSNLIIPTSPLSLLSFFAGQERQHWTPASGTLFLKVQEILVVNEQKHWCVVPKPLKRKVWSTLDILKLSLRFEVLWVHKSPSLLTEDLQTATDFVWKWFGWKTTSEKSAYVFVKGFINFLLILTTSEG